MIFKLMGDYVP